MRKEAAEQVLGRRERWLEGAAFWAGGSEAEKARGAREAPPTFTASEACSPKSPERPPAAFIVRPSLSLSTDLHLYSAPAALYPPNV